MQARDDMEVRDNQDRHRFEAVDPEGTVLGFIDYRCRDDRVWLIHTEILDGHEGAGVGSFLVRHTLDDVRERGSLVVPACPYVAGWIRRHPDYADLVDQPAFRELKQSRNRGRRRTVAPTPAGPCSHVPADPSTAPEPRPAEGCAECLAEGRHDWVHLRICVACGHVGCCDNSPGKHGTAHAHGHDHALIRSYEPGENWWYCYVDTVTFEVPDAPPAPSYG